MERKFACYTPSPYYDFRECKMHNNSCEPHCNQPLPCNNLPPPCFSEEHKPPHTKPNYCQKIPTCVVCFLSGIIFSNLIRR